MGDANSTKMVAIAVTIVCGLSGLIAYPFVHKFDKSKMSLFISYVNALTSGVILSVGLMHLIAEGIEVLAELYDYPFSLLMALLGFMFLYFMEDVILPMIMKKKNKHKYGNVMGVVHAHGIEKSVDSSSSCSDCAIDGVEKHQSISIHDMALKEDKDLLTIAERILFISGLFIALIVHSFFAGLSMGIEDQMEDVIITLVAVALHKTLASITLCNNLLAAEVSLLTNVTIMCIFASTTPIGIGVGLAVAKTAAEELDKVGAFIQSFCGGTFLFLSVAILRMQPDKAPNGKVAHALPKFGLWSLGAGIMAVVAIWT